MYATSGSASLSGSEGRPIGGSRRGFNLSGDLRHALFPFTHVYFLRSLLPQVSLCCCVESSAIKGEETWAGLQWCGGRRSREFVSVVYFLPRDATGVCTELVFVVLRK